MLCAPASCAGRSRSSSAQRVAMPSTVGFKICAFCAAAARGLFPIETVVVVVVVAEETAAPCTGLASLSARCPRRGERAETEASPMHGAAESSACFERCCRGSERTQTGGRPEGGGATVVVVSSLDYGCSTVQVCVSEPPKLTLMQRPE